MSQAVPAIGVGGAVHDAAEVLTMTVPFSATQTTVASPHRLVH